MSDIKHLTGKLIEFRDARNWAHPASHRQVLFPGFFGTSGRQALFPGFFGTSGRQVIILTYF
jgi:hypothetical protein